jgi:predicted membrane-bound spermidine synthase
MQPMTEKTGRRALGRTTLFGIFTLSGFSGLIYESIWSHYLKLFLGHAAYAQTLVLTVFMGGMAIGAWLAARWSPKLRNLLLIYAVVEGIVGMIALGFHTIYLAGTSFTFDTLVPAMDSPAAINGVKWTIATLLILPQSVLLGTTFPLISGAVVRRFPDHPGATHAMLYFTNSLGAALGVLTSGFLLIGWVGLPGTVMIAGVVNLLIALYVWRNSGSTPEPSAPPSASGSDGSQVARRILWAAFLSGVAAFVYEIAWIRMLSLVLGSSTHAFELMLSAFILGLAFGGLWIRRRIDSLAQPLVFLAITFALMAAVATLTLPAYGYTFDVIGAAVRGFPRTDVGYAWFNLLSHAVAAFIMIPTTFLAGMTLPVMTHVLLKSADERAIGRVYASNTVGAIAGVILAVHGLLPSVGVKGTVLAGAVIQFAIAVIFAWRQTAPREVMRARMALGTAAVVMLLVGALLQLDPLRMASGVYRQGHARLAADTRMMFLRDGKTATISVVQQSGAVTIATNGKPDASISLTADNLTGDEITMTMAAALPLAMHPAPRQVANIGIGSGLTSHVLLSSPEVHRLDSIEIEPMMVQGAKLGFGARVGRLWDDPRSHIHYEDAKTFFSTVKRPYDVIVSEPSNPWVSGVATLFSDEFYGHVVRHLQPDGLLVQWIQAYETDITIIASILKALSPHFQDYAVYAANDSDIIIVARPVGALAPLANDLYSTPALANELRLVGLQTMGDLDIRRIGNKRMLDALMRLMPVPVNSDFRPFVDLNAPRMRFLNRSAIDLVALSVLPTPLVDIYGAPQLQAASDSVVSAQFLTRHRLAIEAQSLMRALATQDAALAPANTRPALEQLRASASDCNSDVTRDAWIDSVHTLALRTTRFLTVADRAPLWQAVRTAGCASTLTPAESAWVGLLEAVGRGDTRGIAAEGERLFTSANLPALDGEQILEALISTANAQIAVGKSTDARALLDAYLPGLKNPGNYALALRLTLSEASLAGNP